MNFYVLQESCCLQFILFFVISNLFIKGIGCLIRQRQQQWIMEPSQAHVFPFNVFTNSKRLWNLHNCVSILQSS
jgi:hypothetical protein